MTDEPRITTQRLNEMGLGFMPAGTLMAAVQLGLFDALAEGPRDIADIAGKIDLPEDRTDKLVTTCAALDLVTRDGDRVANAPDVDRFLVRGKPTYFGDYLMHLATLSYADWGDLAAQLRAGPGDHPGRYYESGMDADESRALTEAGFTGSQGLARRLTRRFDFSRFKRMLDLGGGSGVYSIEACRQNPDLSAAVYDFENVCVVAREYIAAAGLSDRITAEPFDFINDPLPEGADLVLLCGNLHAYDAATAHRVIQKAYDALPSGGVMILCDYMLDADRSGPLMPAFISLRHGYMGGGGQVRTASEFKEYLESAGFQVEKIEEFLTGSMGWATAVKP